MNNAWIKWHGGVCPVPIGTLVDVEHRSGSIYQRVEAGKRWSFAEDWGIDNEGADIVAYRLSEVVTDEQNDDCQGSALIRSEVAA